jgi:predicted aspartyl protease
MNALEPLLGVVVLEVLGIEVDPVTGKLEHSRLYGLVVLAYNLKPLP